MSAQTTTIISGIVLLIIFALVGWNQKRRRERSRSDRSESNPP